MPRSPFYTAFRRIIPYLVVAQAPLYAFLAILRLMAGEYEPALRLLGSASLALVMWLVAEAAIVLLHNSERVLKDLSVRSD